MIRFIIVPRSIDMYKRVMLPGWTLDGECVFRYYGEALAHLMGEEKAYYSYFTDPSCNIGRKGGDALEIQPPHKCISV